MIIETVTAQAVSLRIPRAELGGRDTITPGEARAAVAHALESSGKRPWKRMEISLFACDAELLLIARPVEAQLWRFRFERFEDLLAASAYIEESVPCDAVFAEDAFQLLIGRSAAGLPNALFEFGEPCPCTPELAEHLKEQGVVIAEDALPVLRRYFGSGSGDS